MSELILHHFDLSPYAEKARLMLGLKGLAWRSVQIPMVMPKPDLTALTGGYRKTPVLQIGADVYCDTSRIARELELRFPDPSLYPDGGAGLACALAVWGDRFFEPGAGLAMCVNTELPGELVRDRREFFTHMDFGAFAGRVPHMFAQISANTALIEDQLADGRDYLLGPRPGLADITAYYVLWMARGFVAATGELLARCERVGRWEARMRGIGHGRRSEVTAAEAHAVAKASTPLPVRGVDALDPSGLRAGQPVTVTPDDYGKVPVSGELVTLDPHEVAVRRSDPQLGELVVHFPRIGYVVAAAA